MRKAILNSSACRLSVLAMLLALGACGGNTAADTSSGTDQDATDQDATDSDATDQEVGDTVSTDDAKPDGDVKVDSKDTDTGPPVGCTSATVASDCTGTLLPCHKWACNTANTCEQQVVAAGTACDDGQLCSQGDKCDASGTCVAGTDTNYGFDKDGKPNTNTCLLCKCSNNPDGSCKQLSTDSGASCDDGNLCTKKDVCQAGGVCIGVVDAPVDATNSCYTNVCDPKTGVFAPQPKAGSDGTPCDDANACTSGSTCTTGICGQGTAVLCDDQNTCTTDSCDKGKGCVFTAIVPLPVGTTLACNDNNPCTQNDACKAGNCKGTDVTKGLQLLPCQAVSCDPSSGQLNYAGAPDGAICDDSDPCTKGDVCASQVCKGANLVCNDNLPCTDDLCDAKKCSAGPNNTTVCGQCVFPQKTDGDPCDDGNKCSSGDACNVGKCNGVPTDCDDKNACTNDSCLPNSGCLHSPVAGNAFCDDGDNCTTVDKCIGTSCKGTTKDCTDTDPCTSDACDPLQPAATNCTHLKFDGPCNDGDTCTSNDVCTGGKCSGTKADCNDGNPCTNDLCDSIKGCQHLQLPGGTDCDDGLACTKNDKCDAGKCGSVLPADNQCNTCNSNADCAKYNDQDFCNGTIKCIDSYKGKVCDTDPATVVKCDATKDNSCTKNTCNPDNGVCAIVKFNAGTFCTGDKCLDNAQCDGIGNCKGITKNCDDKNDCTTDSCDSTIGCKHVNLADATKCDDGSKCTPNDSCKGGQCVGDQNTCGCTTNNDCTGFDDGNLCNGVLTCQQNFCKPDAATIIVCAKNANSCQDNICTPATGKCDPKPKQDNVACDDADACTLSEVCLAGACTSTTKANCDDGSPCTTDYCDPFFGCGNAPIASGGLCDDKNDCTTKDSCKTGTCVGTPLSCDDSNQCTADTCAKKGGCAHTLDDTLTCTDSDPCTTPDHCKDGVCLSTVLNCNDNNSCTIDACDGNGGCKNVVFGGKDCDDGNACTIQDVCVNDQCVGKTKSCDDGNQCTTDVCKDGTCVFTTASGLACTDANECTGPDFCTGAGQCVGAVVDCSTGTVCKTNLTCSPVTGCVTVQNDGALCDDGDFCTSGNLPGTMGDKCQGGGCSGTTVSCDDQNICTNDVCDAKKGCIISQNGCDDGNSCTVDTCDKVLGCQHENVNGGFCDDGDACTTATTCSAGTCNGGTATICDDKNDCTADACDKATGCGHVSMAEASTCTDSNICTADGCVDGICVGVPLTCDDGNPCTADSCNAISGCVHSDMAEGQVCDDGEKCTLGTVCQGGVCSGGKLDEVLCPAFCDATKKDPECKWLDTDGNACNGTFRCINKLATTGHYMCVQDLTIVQCDSTNDGPCLKNTCSQQDGSCSMAQLVNNTPCEDGKGCTVSDTCYNGVCKSGTANECLGAKDACNGAACIEDPNAINGFKCVPMPLDVSVLCDSDTNGCTANDHCSAGKCVAGAAVNCTGIAGVCQVGTCKSTGVNTFTCQTAQAADNAPCDDQQLCTEGDFCKTGKCQPGTKSHDCSAETGVCSIGTCDKTADAGFGACIPTPQNEGQPCDSDSNGCTQGDKCVQGSCVPGTAPDCTAATTDCATGSCKQGGTSTFTCVGAPKVDKLPCEADQNGCTVGDACLSGKCAPGPTKDCSAQTSADGCQVGTCQSLGNSANSCVVVAAQVGTVCNADGSGCTKGDACNALGACVPGPAVDCNTLTNACATGNCLSTSAQTFICSGNPKTNGTVCDADTNGCTQNDSCQNGVCQAGTVVSCGVSSVQCVDKKCTSTGFDKYLCQDLAVADNTACDADQNGCTKGDSCFGGACAAGETQTCSTFVKDCSSATCASTGSSSFNCNVTPVPSYGPLSPPVTCVTTASPSTCPANYTCTSSDGSTNGTCNATAFVTCSDNSACTTGDYCSNGSCVGGLSKSCDDGDICTTDSCNASTGDCVFTAIAGCGKCLNEAFSGGSAQSPNVAVRSRNPAAADWTFNTTNGDFEVSWSATTWVNPATAKTASRLVARKLFLQGASQLDFDLTIGGGTDDFSLGHIEVLVNETSIKSYAVTTNNAKCLSAGGNCQHVTLDLSAWTAAPIDLVFVAQPGLTKPGATPFTAALDNLTVSGVCSTSCVGVDFEPRGKGELTDSTGADVPYIMPQSWKASTTDATYVNWGATQTAGHTGSSELVASWSGKPTSGTPQVAKLTIPQVSVVAGNVLKFAVKTSFGDASCNSDDLSVRVNTAAGTVAELVKVCDASSGWVVQSYDLTAFINSTVDIDLVVTTGSGTTAKGTVEIDDIAVTGACSYLCLSDDFETGGLAKWSVATTDSVSKMKAFAASTAQFTSGTTSAFAQYDTTATDGKLAYMTGDPAKGTIVQLPVLGATLFAQTNAFAAAIPATCSSSAASAIFWYRAMTVASGLTPQTTIAGLVADVTEPFINSGCDTTSGFKKQQWTVAPKAAYDIFVPNFYLVKQAGSTSAKLYVDDVQVICQ
jgi:hypothetical protein